MSPEDAVAQAGGGVIWDEAFPYTEGKAPLTGRYANSSGGGKSGGTSPRKISACSRTPTESRLRNGTWIPRRFNWVR